MSENIDTSSLKLQQELNPKVWDKDMNINPKIRETLIQIANDFFEDFEVDVPLADIRLLGSLTNYNWSKYSDFDLHLIVDFDIIYKTLDPKGEYDKEEFVQAYFNGKKTIWNDTHNIKIYGFDVEIYVEDLNAHNASEAAFSLLNNEWIRKPIKRDIKIDYPSIKKKVAYIESAIDSLEHKTNIEKSVKKLKDKIKKMRQAGLDAEGEFSSANLAFKLLRRNGYLDKLAKLGVEDYDKEMSLNEGVYSSTFTVNLKNGKEVKRGSNGKEYKAVYVDVYDNGEHIIKSWSSNHEKLGEFKKEAQKYNEKRIPHMNKVFPKYKFSKITDTYMVKPKKLTKI